MYKAFYLIAFLFSVETYSQAFQIPEWFLNDIQQMTGTWVADNSPYVSEQEPYPYYASEWKPGLDNKSLTGRLYGITKEGREINFWEFRQYWDNESSEAKVIQFGRGNMIGQGKYYPVSDQILNSIQTFSLPDGRKWVEKHESSIRKDTLITTSFDLKKDGDWEKKRTYYWIKNDTR